MLVLGCSEVLAGGSGTSYVTKWKHNADAALSLTFDDNATGHDEMAAFLDEFGVRGTFYVITSYMNEEMFLEISDRGHELGSHSVNNTYMDGASMETIVFELTESKVAIENLTGTPCVSFAAPYGQLDPNVVEVARDLYISSRGTGSGINAIAGADIFRLKIGPFPPYYDDPNTNWTNEYYCQRMKEYLEDAIEVQGWGIQMFHNWTSRAEWNSGYLITDTVLRDYLSMLTIDFVSNVWVAPQGQVARYFLERQETEVNTSVLTDNVILVDLLFDGDKKIFNEPLTIITQIPAHYLEGDIAVIQNGTQLSHEIGAYDVVSEPVDSLRITGDIYPDATDIYVRLPDNYGGKPAYKAKDKEFYVWYKDTDPCYYLSTILGGTGYACWFSINGKIPVGDYRADTPNVTGTPKVLVVPRNVFSVKYDAIPGAGAVSIAFEPILDDLN